MKQRPTACAATRARVWIAGLALLCLTGALAPGAVSAQAQGQGHASIGDGAGQLPDLPSGPATLIGRVVHPTRPDAAAHLEVVLYALSPDGAPGLGTTFSGDDGSFRFDALSNAPGVMYLLGTRYQDVPYGSRVTFEDGALERVVEIPVTDVTTRTDALRAVQSAYKLDWVGARLRVQVQHRLHNAGSDVILHDRDAEARAPLFRAALPDGAEDWTDGQSGFGNGWLREGDEIAWYGPAYPGDQEVSFQYFLTPPAGDPNAEAGPELSLSLRFPAAPGEVIVLSPLGAPAPDAPALRVADEPESFDGAPYRRLESDDLGAGDRLALRINAPPSGHDAENLTISRADVWVDPDDAAMRVTVELQLSVAGAQQLVARPGEVLLSLPLPEDAELLGVSEQARALGVEAGDDGRIGVIGPVPPGASTLGYKYRVPVDPEHNVLDFGLARPVALLNVLVADTGIDVSSTRLHRRRPFRQGTRIYLHREAYQLAAGEQVEVRLRALDRSNPPKSAIALLALLAAAVGAAFLAAPLRGKNAVRDALADRRTVLSQERAGVYESIRDIEHDFETGKIDASEHARMRAELKQEALDLLRQEREETASQAEAAATAATVGATPGAAASPEPGGFCPHCGKPVAALWQFCSHCGGRLDGDRDKA